MTAPGHDTGHEALELARRVGYEHLMLPGTLSTKKPRPKRYSLLGETTPEMIADWLHEYRDREIMWMVRCGWLRGGMLAVLDTDTPLAGVIATQKLPPTSWTVATRSPGHFHRYYLLADPIEEYEGRSDIHTISLKSGMNEVVAAPSSSGYTPEPGFGQGEPPRLTAKAWNHYIRYMKTRTGSGAARQGQARKDALPATSGEGLCCNPSLGWPRGDHPYQCHGESASAWRNFLRSVCCRFVYRRWLSEGKVAPTLSRTLIYMQRVLDNNRCHEHTYDQFDKLIRDTWERASERASDDGYRESQARKGRLRAAQLWGPSHDARTARNRAIMDSLNAGRTRAEAAREHGVCTRTVTRVRRLFTSFSPPRGG